MRKKNRQLPTKSKETLSWKEMEKGCAVTEPGNAAELRTGDWRAERPIWNFDRCIKCGTCLEVCPERFSAVTKLSAETMDVPREPIPVKEKPKAAAA